jgi:hypothetical protein
MDKKLEQRVARLEKYLMSEASSSTKWDDAIIEVFNKENKGEYQSYNDWKDGVLREKLQNDWFSDNLTIRIFSQILPDIGERFLSNYEVKGLHADNPEYPVLEHGLDLAEGSVYSQCEIQHDDCWDIKISWFILNEDTDDYYFDKSIRFKGTGVIKKGTNYDCLVSYFNAYENFLNTSASDIMGQFIEKYKPLAVDRKRLDRILSDIKDFYAQYKAACSDYLDEGGDEEDIEIAISDINGVI